MHVTYHIYLVLQQLHNIIIIYIKRTIHDNNKEKNNCVVEVRRCQIVHRTAQSESCYYHYCCRERKLYLAIQASK